ncbi:MAG: hypothetical protein L3J46_03870 [Kangiellaceae bacterium]|nr:hypothetical protein [Kangiellaceae bacterium]
MTQKLTDFLTRLATDEQLVTDFKQGAKATMELHDVSDEHIELVLGLKYDEIQELLGENFRINSNTIIKAFKN